MPDSDACRSRLEARRVPCAMQCVQSSRPRTRTPAALAKKQRKWNALLASQAYEHEKLVADAWCAAFVWPKNEPGSVVEAAPNDGHVARAPRQGGVPVSGARRDHTTDRRGLWPLPLGAGVSAGICTRRFRRRARQPALGARQAPGAGVLRQVGSLHREGAERRRAKEAHRCASSHGPGALE